MDQVCHLEPPQPGYFSIAFKVLPQKLRREPSLWLEERNSNKSIEGLSAAATCQGRPLLPWPWPHPLGNGSNSVRRERRGGEKKARTCQALKIIKVLKKQSFSLLSSHTRLMWRLKSGQDQSQETHGSSWASIIMSFVTTKFDLNSTSQSRF